ncbi:MAG TPA: hypothetical protein VNV82_06090 [Bryobacteraceae bacterium]|jgi:hypothetical protein|nr:hypothetical protein [Bryobacteraceae bacterium]
MNRRILLFVSLAISLAINGLSQNGSSIFTYISGPNFCLAEYGYTVPAFCTAPGELPLASFPIPPINGFYVDRNFGAKVRLLTDGTTDSLHQYSTPSAFSATGKYVLLAKVDGSTRVVNTATANIVADLSFKIDYWAALWSPVDDDVLYGLGDDPVRTQITKYQVSTATKSIVVDYAKDGHHFTNIQNGSTGDLSADNWAAFWAQNEHQVCAVDLNRVKTFCADYTASNPNNRVGWNFIDYVTITKGVDVDTNKRYVLLMAQPAMGVYSVNEQTGNLDFEFRGPEMPAGIMGGDNGPHNHDGICDPGEDCFGNPHADVFQDNGRQYILVDSGQDLPTCEDDLVSLQISKGINMLTSVDAGGGRKIFFTLFKCGVTWSDLHFGCAKSANAFCVVSTDLPAANLPNQIRDGRTPFEDEVIVIRGNGVEARRVAEHRSVRVNYWDTPRACISNDGSMVLWDSNFGNPANHRVVIAETGFGSPPIVSACTYTLNTNSLDVTATGGSGTITVTPSATTCGSPTASSNVSWATATASGNTVDWTVSGNSGSQSRTGSLSVAGETVTINQSGTVSTVSMTLFPNSLVLGTNGTLITTPQQVSLSFAGGGNASWTATSSVPNIVVSPASGVGNVILQISVSAGSSGVVTVNAPGAANSPQAIQVQISTANVKGPFGSFDTPLNAAKVSAAVPVTGWALDSIGISKVDIWREPIGSEPAGLVYIGDAVFVPGARPDVARAFSTYPNATVAGWGYLMLTNFLPNANYKLGSGNGTYILHALAHNQGGAVVDLGARTIMVDNADATQPFGTIDTPAQGGTVWGNAYVNFGWALTPMPAAISTDGTTITVNIDGVTVAHPTYNQFRGDIATVFPGYANSNGAIGFAYIDTTKFSNGLHSISWNVWDNQLRGNGVGSRFFKVLNVGTPTTSGSSTSSELINAPPASGSSQAADRLAPIANSPLSLDVQEMDRIEVPLGAISGYIVANGERQPLPIGSTLQDGVFYWQLAPVFLGQYDMVFERPDGTPLHLRVVVRAKTYSGGEQQAVQ